MSICKLFRRFFRNFSKVAALLNGKLRTDEWKTFPSLCKAEEEAVENLKTILTKPSDLAIPRTTSRYTIETDACDT